MSAQHTPGPWVAEVDGRTPVKIVAGADIVGYAIFGPRSDVNVEFAGSKAIAEANARLFAAAPDLLAKVQEFAAACAECDGTGSPEFGKHAGESCPDCADIRAVIAKAVQP